MMKYTFVSRGEAETAELGRRLAERLPDGALIALDGDLGAGKTVFARGFARGLGVLEDILSPTFTLLRTYEGRFTLHHFDVYRIASEDELIETGFEDIIYGGGVTLVEWACKIPGLLPEDRISVAIGRGDGEEERMITIQCAGRLAPAVEAALC